jgi:sugar phosphate isomerase/epimerase
MKVYHSLLMAAAFIGVCLLAGACHNGPSDTAAAGSDSTALAVPGWTMGIALYSFNQHPFTAALDKVDSAHVTSVEGFSFYKLGKAFGDSTMKALSPQGIARMAKMMKDKGISMQSIYVEGSKDPEEWKKFFEMGKTLGVRYLVCEPAKDQWNMADSLAGIYGIPIAIHEHSKELSAYWHPDSVLAAMKGHPNFGACADLGHWARSGLDVVQCLQKLKGHILGIHLKDIDSLNNTKAADVIVGTGVIDFPAVIRELKRQDFKGMIYMECEHKMDNNLPDVIQSLQYFDKLAGQGAK